MRDTSAFQNFKDVIMAAIMDLAEEDGNVVFLDADLASCIGSTAFQERFPDRFRNVGIAEANMAAVAGGMASVGYVPFIHSFGCFASRRMYDQLFISVGYAHRCVHVIGSDPGIIAQYNGGTHMPFEDIALMRQIPGFTIYEPSDAMSMYSLIVQAYKLGKPSYLRAPRKGIIHRYGADEEIMLGKAITAREGSDITIIATGAYLVEQALKAAEALSDKGCCARVLDLHTIMPFDTEAIEKAARETGRIIVCENGRYAGGVGEMVSYHLLQSGIPVRAGFINVGDRFGEVGSLEYLASAFGFTAEDIEKKALSLL